MALLVTNLFRSKADPRVREDLARRLGLAPGDVMEWTCVRESMDARARPPRAVTNWKVEVGPLEPQVLARGPKGVRTFSARDEERHGAPSAPTRVRWTGSRPPVVVGAGPSGLFAALRFAEGGVPVVLLERGEPVETRTDRVHLFWREGVLDPESNVLFGEGGAGAFSDGKIYTRRRDGEVGTLLDWLVRFGADPDIRTASHPHLGTDRLKRILQAMRSWLVDHGVQVRFGARVDGLVVDGARCTGLTLSDGTVLESDMVLLGVGHSARDTHQMLVSAGLAAEARPMAVGVRVEHPQALLSRGFHGGTRDRTGLPAAEYRLTWNPPEGRSAFTFCMCPGGLVVAATHLEGRLCLNGMSFSGRNGPLSNAALVAQVLPSDYPGASPLDGFRYQDLLEARCFMAGGSRFQAPAQRASDLLAGRPSTSLPRSSYSRGVTPVDLREVLPAPLLDCIRQALASFDRRCPGFAGPEALVLAPEARTTSPIRYLRGPERESTTLAGVYPMGEGAGYGGGILSSALDGWKSAESVLARLGSR